MEFWKMNGAGNDFIVVDDRRNAIPENRWPEIVRACVRGICPSAQTASWW